MRKNRILTFTMCIIICLFLIMPTCVYGDTVSDSKKNIEQIKKSIADKQNKLNTNLNNATDTKKQKVAIDKEITDANDNMSQLNSIISKCDDVIAQKNVDIAGAQVTLDKNKDALKTRVRYLYEHGSVTYLDVLFGSSSFSDFLDRLTLLQDIVAHDKKLVDEVEKAKSTLEDSKRVIEEQKNDKVESLSLVDSQKQRLENANAANDKYLAQINSNNEELKNQIAEEDKAIERENAKINKALAAAQSKSPNTKYSGGKMAWPVPAGGRISSPFGYRTDPAPGNHTGVDIAIAAGNAIVAANNGTVIIRSYDPYGYGNYVVIDHGGGISTLYGHASAIYVSKGQVVKRGEKIAAVGSTGYSTGPHLHFEVRINGTRVNPLPYIQ